MISSLSSSEAIHLLAAELDAEVIAWRDKRGFFCPNPISPRALTEHLRFAHGMSVDDGEPPARLTDLHAAGHNGTLTTGFTHLHPTQLPQEAT